MNEIGLLQTLPLYGSNIESIEDHTKLEKSNVRITKRMPFADGCMYIGGTGVA